MKAAKGAGEMPILRPNAAGIDIGATEIYVAVPSDRDSEPVRSFPTFTEDLHRLADWLKACGIETVAMEATGVYWDPVVPDSGSARVRGVPGQCSVLPECSRPANRCFRLSVVAIPAFGGTLASILSAGGSGLRAGRHARSSSITGEVGQRTDCTPREQRPAVSCAALRPGRARSRPPPTTHRARAIDPFVQLSSQSRNRSYWRSYRR